MIPSMKGGAAEAHTHPYPSQRAEVRVPVSVPRQASEHDFFQTKNSAQPTPTKPNQYGTFAESGAARLQPRDVVVSVKNFSARAYNTAYAWGANAAKATGGMLS